MHIKSIYVINMFYSDYKRVFEKLGINNTEAYIKMTEATLTDPDAPEGAVFVRYEATHQLLELGVRLKCLIPFSFFITL